MAFTIRYQTVFELSIWHHQFLDPLNGPAFTPPPQGVLTPEQIRLLFNYDTRNFMRVLPTPTSLETLQQRGLRFIETNKGGLVFAKDNFLETDSAVKISLFLFLTDPEFYNYTSFDFTQLDGQIFYLTNFGLAPAPRIMLSEDGGNPNLRAIHRKNWNPRLIRLDQTSPDPIVSAQITDLNTNPEAQVLDFTIDNPTELSEVELDGRSLREGAYRLRLEDSNAVVTNEEYFLGLEEKGGLFGVVEIFLEGLSEAQFDIEIAKI